MIDLDTNHGFGVYLPLGERREEKKSKIRKLKLKNEFKKQSGYNRLGFPEFRCGDFQLQVQLGSFFFFFFFGGCNKKGDQLVINYDVSRAFG